MIDFLAGFLIGGFIAYFIGKRHGYVEGFGKAIKASLSYAARKAQEPGWPARADRDDYGQKTEK